MKASSRKAQPRRQRGAFLCTLFMLQWRSSLALPLCYQLQQTRNSVASRSFLTTLQFSDTENDEFISSVLYEGTFQGMDDGMLTYLPDGGKTMPPKTRRFISQITSEYVYGVEGRPNLDARYVMELLDSEYDTLPVSVNVGNRTFEPEQGELLAVRIVSLGVLYRLPAEILIKVLDCASPENPALFDLRSEFEAMGWKQVSFPAGLGLRIKKGLISRTTLPAGQSFFPPSRIPWRSRSSSKAAEAAQRGIQLAAEAEAPEQNIMTKEEFLVEIENEIHAAPFSEVSVSEPTDSLPSKTLVLEDALPSFPSQRSSLAWTKVKRLLMNPSHRFANNKAWKRLSSVWNTQYNKLKGAGRAGLMAYAFMNFVLYTVGITWQWRRIAVEVPPPSGATILSLSIRKFVKAFTRVYVGSAVFKLARIAVSLAMAPTADRVLRFTQRKLKVSENTAFIILVTLLLKTFFGTLAIVCLGDSALWQALRPSLQVAGA